MAPAGYTVFTYLFDKSNLLLITFTHKTLNYHIEFDIYLKLNLNTTKLEHKLNLIRSSSSSYC